MTASEVLVESLIDWGVDTIFGLPGDGINGFVDALRTHHNRIRYIHVRHEETAAMAAAGYAKFTGKLGVCFATSGPGAIHLMNGLYDAKIDQAPVLAITGMTYHDLIGTSYLQDMNQDYVYQDVAIYNQRLMGPAHAKNIVDAACRAALSNRAVAHLALPIDYQVAEMKEQKRFHRNVKGHTSEAFTVPRRIPERVQLEKAARLLQGKTKVTILVGAGARGAREEVLQVAERLAAPVVKALLGKDVIPDDSPYTTGGTGVVGTRASSDVFESCDALLIIGSSFPYVEFLPKPGQAVGVQIDDKPERIGLRYPVDLGLVGDAQATLRELLMYLPRNEDRSFLKQAQAGMQEWWDLMEERGSRTDKPMHPQVVSWNLSQLLNDDAIICGDSGTVTTHVARMKLRAHQKFSFSGTLCSMAAGLPYSIGAQAAYPGRQVVVFTGDGSMSMAMGDLATLVQHRLPVKIIVLKNNTLGLIKWEQMIFNNYFFPHTARAAVDVLESAGYRVQVPMRSSLCCGRPLFDYGMLDEAKSKLEEILDALQNHIESGTPVVVLEPSCASVFRDELTALFPRREDAQRLRQQTFTLAEFLSAFPTIHPPWRERRSCTATAIRKQSSAWSTSRSFLPAWASTPNCSIPAVVVWPVPSVSKRITTTSR